jgi:putative FmdB family regulatory protein
VKSLDAPIGVLGYLMSAQSILLKGGADFQICLYLKSSQKFMSRIKTARQWERNKLLYEYECCGQKFEKILPIALRDEATCPKCGRKVKHRIATNTRHIMNFKPDWAYAWKQGKRF